MKAVVVLFWDICRLRRGPDQVPTQGVFVLLIAFLYSALAFVGNTLMPAGQGGIAWIVTFIATALMMVFCLSVLIFKQLTARFVATITALMGVEVVIGAVLLPFIALARIGAPFPAFIMVGYLVVMSWELTVRGFIFHRAFNVSLLLGSVMALALFVTTTWLIYRLFPQLAG